MTKKATAGARILASMKQITRWAEGDESAARLITMTQPEFVCDFRPAPGGRQQLGTRAQHTRARTR